MTLKRSVTSRKTLLTGICNPIVDILVNVDDSVLDELEFEKATTRLVNPKEQDRLLQALEGKSPKLASGGSVGNSVVAFAQLGGKAGLIGSIGDDRYGLFYKNECEALGIEFPGNALVGEPTGTSVVLITPDAERTMRTCLGAAAALTYSSEHEDQIADSEWLFVEGFLLANPEFGQPAVLAAVEAAKKFGTKVAFTCSEAFVIGGFRPAVEKVLSCADLVFANEAEACALANEEDGGKAFELLADQLPGVVVTRGPAGALVSLNSHQCHVPSFPCEPRDLTGAGDMFAGAFLYGMMHKVSAQESALKACYLASKVIEHVGARLAHGTSQLWQNAPSRAHG